MTVYVRTFVWHHAMPTLHTVGAAAVPPARAAIARSTEGASYMQQANLLHW